MTNPSTPEISRRYNRAIKLADGTRQVPDDPDYWLRVIGVLLDRLDSVHDLVWIWREHSLAAVPEEYSKSRAMINKYLHGDNAAAGVDACADELIGVLKK